MSKEEEEVDHWDKELGEPQPLDINDYQKEAARTSWGWNGPKIYSLLERLVIASTGLSSEVGEINEICREAVYARRVPDDNTCARIEEEAGDILYYLALLCETMGVNLEDAAHTQIEKARRKYPDRFGDYYEQPTERLYRYCKEHDLFVQMKQENPYLWVTKINFHGDSRKAMNCSKIVANERQKAPRRAIKQLKELRKWKEPERE